MDIERLIDKFRAEVHDTAKPPLWTDEEVFSYLDEAQKWYCRITGGIADSTSVAAQIPLVVGEPFAVLHDRVLKLRHVQRRSDSKEVDVWNFEDAEFRPSFDTAYNVPRKLILDSTKGPVSKVITGMEQGKVRCIYIPEVVDTLDCVVFRMPLKDISVGEYDKLEIVEEDHVLLLDGMKAQAYKKEDAETFDKSRQEKHEAVFLGKCEEAKHKREKREHKYRTIRYGGL